MWDKFEWVTIYFLSFLPSTITHLHIYSLIRRECVGPEEGGVREREEHQEWQQGQGLLLDIKAGCRRQGEGEGPCASGEGSCGLSGYLSSG
jgi:hypothetical protein